MLIRFVKYQALGNDYLVFEQNQLGFELKSEQIRQICDRHFGVGADGILVGPLQTEEADYAVRIFNPDGSEAEKSGNGLRIFARYLWDSRPLEIVKNQAVGLSRPFSIQTAAGNVICIVQENGDQIKVEMGEAVFDCADKLESESNHESILEEIKIDGILLTCCVLDLGNPHCVILGSPVEPDAARRLGPKIETHARFPQKTNVQFLQVIDRDNIRIEIWERGVGYTLASGTSSCAAAAVAHRLRKCNNQITVHNPGGLLSVAVSRRNQLILTGPVEKVFEGSMELE